MKRLMTIEEVNDFFKHEVITVYKNFDQILNGEDEAKAAKGLDYKPFYAGVWTKLHKPEYYIKENAEIKIYDLGSGYYMMTSNQGFHKAVDHMLVEEGCEKTLPDFDETITIYKVV